MQRRSRGLGRAAAAVAVEHQRGRAEAGEPAAMPPGAALPALRTGVTEAGNAVRQVPVNAFPGGCLVRRVAR
jgi:hypothetical protein